MEKRQLIRIYFKGRAVPIMWSPLPGDEMEYSPELALMIGKPEILRLKNDEGFTIIHCEDIQAVEVINRELVVMDDLSVEDFARLAIEKGCAASDLAAALLKEIGRHAEAIADNGETNT